MMALEEPDPEIASKQRRALRIYVFLFVTSSSVVSVALSVLGYLPFDPLTALIAGIIAGFAFALFQLTYMRFVGHTSYRVQKRKPMLQ
jgi:hypothetical protein